MESARATTLETRHGELETKIEAERRSLSVDDLQIVQLKREKLRLKDALHKG